MAEVTNVWTSSLYDIQIGSSSLYDWMCTDRKQSTSSLYDSKYNDMNQFTMWQQMQWHEPFHHVTASAMTWTNSPCDSKCNDMNQFTMWQQMQWENPVHQVTASAVREASSLSDSKCNERSLHWVTELLYDRITIWQNYYMTEGAKWRTSSLCDIVPSTGHKNPTAQPKTDKCPSSTSHFSPFNCF